MAPSKNEARRLVTSGAVTLNGDKILEPNSSFKPDTEGVVVKVGKRKFIKVKAEA